MPSINWRFAPLPAEYALPICAQEYIEELQKRHEERKYQLEAQLQIIRKQRAEEQVTAPAWRRGGAQGSRRLVADFRNGLGGLLHE